MTDPPATRSTVSTRFRPGDLWRHPDFLKLWAGHTISLGGSLIGRFALPLVAILTLDASPAEVDHPRFGRCRTGL